PRLAGLGSPHSAGAAHLLARSADASEPVTERRILPVTGAGRGGLEGSGVEGAPGQDPSKNAPSRPSPVTLFDRWSFHRGEEPHERERVPAMAGDDRAPRE